MILIGLNGRLQSGKDTAFDYLSDQFASRGPWVRAAFADKLKMSAAFALGFDPDSVEEAVAICNELKEAGHVITRSGKPEANFGEVLLSNSRRAVLTGREFLQRYGTEAHRYVFGTNFWVDALLPRNEYELDLRFPGAELVVITDTRFENEAQRILDLGGEVWKINADHRLGPLPEDAHPSEHGLPRHLVTSVIDNNSDLKTFHTNLEHTYLAAIGHIIQV